MHGLLMGTVFPRVWEGRRTPSQGEPSIHPWPGGQGKTQHTPRPGENAARTAARRPGENPAHTAPGGQGRTQHTPATRRPGENPAYTTPGGQGRTQHTPWPGENPAHTRNQAARGEPSTHRARRPGENPAHTCSQAARASDRESPTHPQPGGQRRTQHTHAVRWPGLPFTGWPQVACAPDVIRRAAVYFHDLLRQPVTPSYREKNRRRGALQYS